MATAPDQESFPAPPVLDAAAERRRNDRSRVIAWSLVGLVVLFFLGTGIRIAGATASTVNLVTGALLIVGVLMPGLVFTLPLRFAWVMTGLMAAGTIAVWVMPNSMGVRVVSLVLTLIVTGQMIVRTRAAKSPRPGVDA